MAEAVIETAPLTRKDLVSGQEVRWCPGCGDYAILAQMQRVLPEMGIPREKIVFVSGIGCSSRFPYYMNTYGIHSIHGRAPTLATGLKVANPDLTIFVISGDGDSLSIGGNHFLHVLRRNVDLNYILFNNRIYGLTKGQYSPTSLPGHITKSSPMGSIEQSFNPLSVAIGAEATFVARTVDRNTKHMAEMLKRATEHKGTSFVEIYQNCNIFNDGAWFHVTEASRKDDNALVLEHDQPMVFGKDKDRGIRLNGLTPEVVTLGNGITEDDLLVHDERTEQPALAYLLSRLEHPTPIGVFRCIERPTYERQVVDQGVRAVEEKGKGDLLTLYNSADTWIVPEEAETHRPEDLRELPEEHIPDDIIPSIDEVDPLAPKTELQHLMTDSVASLELPDPELVSSETTLEDAIGIITDKNVGCLLVVNEDSELIGIFAQGDVFTKIAGQEIDLESTTIQEFMTPDPTTLRRSASIGHVMHLMALHGFRHIPIVDGKNHPVAVATFKQILKFVGGVFANMNGNSQ